MSLIIKIKNLKYYKRILKEINWQKIFNIFVFVALISLIYFNYSEYKQIQKCKKIIIMQARIIKFLRVDTQNIRGDMEILDSIIRVQEEKIKESNKK